MIAALFIDVLDRRKSRACAAIAPIPYQLIYGRTLGHGNDATANTQGAIGPTNGRRQTKASDAVGFTAHGFAGCSQPALCNRF